MTVTGYALLVAGTFLIVSGAVGVLRLPDVYNRANAVTKAASLGLVLVLAGVMFLMPRPGVIVTLALAIAAQLFTAPIGGYAVGRAAYRSGAPFTASTHRDELADRRRALAARAPDGVNRPASPDPGSPAGDGAGQSDAGGGAPS